MKWVTQLVWDVENVYRLPYGCINGKKLLDDNGVRETFPDKTVDSLCPYCGVGCQTKVFVKDNKIVQVDRRDGPANNQKLCVKVDLVTIIFITKEG